MRFFTLLCFILFGVFYTSWAQSTIQGKIIDNTTDEVIVGASVEVATLKTGAVTNEEGLFSFEIDLLGSVELKISHVSYINKQINITLPLKEPLLIKLEEDRQVLEQVSVNSNRDGIETAGLQKLDPMSVNESAIAFNEFNRVLATLPGVISNNELTSSYSVRGGNFDENLIYVNGIEIYRPMLARAGQQEGLSFINPDLVQNISFSSGGWEAKYGDKLSSSLNVTYKEADSLSGSVGVGLLGGSAAISTPIGENDKLLIGARYKNARYLFNSLETNGEYQPRFLDFQGFYTHKFSDKTKLDVLATFAQNDYRFEPTSRETDFGAFQQKLRFVVFYEGAESLSYRSFQGGLRLTHHFSDALKSALILSAYTTSEYEYNNTEGAYRLCDVDQDASSSTFDRCISERGAGSNFLYARNILDAHVYQITNRNDLQLSKNQLISFGVEAKYRAIQDRLDEYEFRDSADFVQVTRVVDQNNTLNAHFIKAYGQYEYNISKRQFLNAGLRVGYSSLSDEVLLSPRVRYSLALDATQQTQLSLATGLYRQFPFYRELRDYDGSLTQNLNAQSAWHIIAGFSKQLEIWERPFKISTEAYYKYLFDVIPYEVDNVRLRYFPQLTGTAYATGADFRMSGEFIPGAQSWFSFGVLSTKEIIENDGQGAIRRPTDQRVTAAIFFQDYFPNNPTIRVNLKLQVGSGLPFGPPNNLALRNSFTGEWYRRLDVGFSKVLFFKPNQSLSFLHSLWLGADILNVLGASNTISYTWIEDVNSINFAIPNSLSARFLNIKIIGKF